LANHRGSAFGGIGLGAQPSQKNFEAELWFRLRELKRDYIFMEAESRKIGRLSVPSFLLNKIRSGRKVLVKGSLRARSHRLLHEYSEELDRPKVIEALEHLHPLKERIGADRLAQLVEQFKSGRYIEFIETLLIDYYDPLYQKQILAKTFDLTIDSDDAHAAAVRIQDWLLRTSLLSGASASTDITAP